MFNQWLKRKIPDFYSSEEIKKLYIRASEWYVMQEEFDIAISILIKAKLYDEVALLLKNNTRTLMIL